MRKRPGVLRLRYALMLAGLILLVAAFLPEREREREATGIVEAETQLARSDLVTISPELIREHNLTIDWDFQSSIAAMAQRYKVDFTAVVVMDACRGDVLALYGKNEEGENCSLCLNAYLGASLFKIVTAVAALDQGDVTSTSTFSYTGKPHTLYRYQLSTEPQRWSHKVTLARAFALSNNVVFGKLGTHQLREEPLLLTAMRLGFWKAPLSEVDCLPSTLFIPRTDYNLAELASGFNRQTRISPIHAAQMITAVLNSGSMVVPRLVQSGDAGLVDAMSDEAASELSSMMVKTVRAGTVSRAFRSVRYDRVLKHVTIGAKSGSINGDEPEGRRNWFVGFARHDSTGDAIAIACLVIRGDYYWIEADDFSRRIIRSYFSRPTTVAQKNS
ncbi:MAG TPA: hypothetical protein ENN34_00385 [Deltaproteobacteria bacterium]|nr:hypothetical protein [Deltaproteobacteria bacterium]